MFFQIIKWAGAVYLVWLGVQAWRHSGPTDAAAGPVEVVPRNRPSLRSGVLVGLTNPKCFVLFAAILPQFVNRPAGHVPLQMLLLAVVPIVIGLVTDCAWGLAAGQAKGWLTRPPRRARTLGRVGGLSMIGLGVSVAVTGQPD